MQSIEAQRTPLFRVVVEKHVGGLAVYREERVLDVVGVSTGHAPEIRVLLVDAVVAGTVKPADDVARRCR